MGTHNSKIRKGKEAIILKNTETLLSFKVDDVAISSGKPYLKKAEDVLRQNLEIETKLEDFSNRAHNGENFLAGEIPGFIMALHTAFQHHYPLKLSVSDFIILIGQGIGRHIDANAEELRKYFVNHEGKENIVIVRNEFVQGKQNDWSTVFGEFADQIKQRVKTDIYDVVVDDTSVATPNSRIVSEITLMDCMKHYFDFSVMTCCGYPEIALEGSPDDWKKLREKFRKLVEMNKNDCMKLDFWLKHLGPVIEEICENGITRTADAKFWSDIYKYNGPKGSGDTPKISGWCTVFFPYLVNGQVNGFEYPAKLKVDAIPKQMSQVPFTWNYYGNPIPMTFYGGFIGAQFDKETKAVSAAHFWCVASNEDEKKKEND